MILKKKLSDEKLLFLILSNPHNPTGNIWDRDTLARIGVLCEKHGVVVVSDEIHCDLLDPGYEYTPYASVSSICAENSITCIAPTKTFNLAGLLTAGAVIRKNSQGENRQRAGNLRRIYARKLCGACRCPQLFREGDRGLTPFANTLRKTSVLWRNILRNICRKSKRYRLMQLT